MLGCQSRIILSDPAVAITLALGEYTKAFTPLNISVDFNILTKLESMNVYQRH